MVYNYPFFNFPRPKRYPSYNMPSYYNTTTLNFNNKFNNAKQNNLKETENLKASSKGEEAKDEYIFEIFGLKLHFDDVLIICLIFFLYQEGVNDEYLFMALILLLLS